ncbi:purine permease 21-like [Salvia splendens]|uniref:purine permease 21-like n=1 Tax=Salvia splendens TaxID=180675 RepID=UPI001C280D84|nr:purine permease 21-like [Salvia splendens]
MDIPIQETDSNSTDNNANSNKNNTLRCKKWSETAVYSLLVLSGQSAATLLGRFYYEKGGKSKYMAALVQTAGFPLLVPFIFIIKSRNKQTSSDHTLALPALYACFGTFLAFICMLYSVGLMYLPLSTFSLICATQLGFNALFSNLINTQKLSPTALNSVFLLTLSSVLLALQPGAASEAAPGGKYAAGFACTLGGAAGYALVQSAEQLAYGKVLRRQTVKEIMDVIFYESMVASLVLVSGLFGSGEWRQLKGEVEGFEMGKAGYAAVVVGSAAAWQVFGVGMVALIIKISAVFGNVVSAVGVGVVPVVAVVVFKDEMSGVKVVALLLALWGSLSYVYHHFLVHHHPTQNGNVDPPPETCTSADSESR